MPNSGLRGGFRRSRRSAARAARRASPPNTVMNALRRGFQASICFKAASASSTGEILRRRNRRDASSIDRNVRSGCEPGGNLKNSTIRAGQEQRPSLHNVLRHSRPFNPVYSRQNESVTFKASISFGNNLRVKKNGYRQTIGWCPQVAPMPPRNSRLGLARCMARTTPAIRESFN
jgi:hypothetical protein